MTALLTRQPDWFLHAYLASNLDERLALLKQPPQNILLAGADGNESYRLLSVRYPKAQFQEFDSRADYLHWSLLARKAEQNLWQKISQTLPLQSCSDQLPSTEQADMVWSNLSLIHQINITTTINNWAQALRTDGLLFFSHFGPDTFEQLRLIWQNHNINVSMPMLIDMHDLGDLLLQNGFYDPVMDMSKLTLQYTQLERLIEDMRVAGLWQSLQFENEEAAIRVLMQSWPQTQLQNITLELIYGHGVKQHKQPDNTHQIQFYPSTPPTPH